MSVSSTEELDRLDMCLPTRPAGRNIISFAVEEFDRLRFELSLLKTSRDQYREECEQHGRPQVAKLKAALHSIAALECEVVEFGADDFYKARQIAREVLK